MSQSREAMAKKHGKRCSAPLVTREKQTKTTMRDFPGGPMVKNLPYKAGEAGSNPGQGTKLLPATGQLSLCAASET